MLFVENQTKSLTESLVDGAPSFEVISGAYLNEAYFGKSSKLVECEKILDELVRKQKTGALKSSVNHANNQDAINKLEKLLSDQFNCNLSLDIWGTHPLGVAFTIPPLFGLELLSTINKQKVLKGETSYVLAERASVYVQVSSAIFNRVESGAEVLSVILHEIGHNFYQASYLGKVVAFVFTLSYFFQWLILWLNGKVINALKVSISKIPGISSIYDIYDWMLSDGDFAIIVEKINNLTLVTILNKIIVSIALHIPSVIKELLTTAGDGYVNEKFADDFATLHGYPEVGMALTNYTAPKTAGDLNILNLISCIVMIPIELVDVHPSIGTRVTQAITTLERALAEAKASKASPAVISKISNDLKLARAGKARFDEAVKKGHIIDTSVLDSHFKNPLFAHGRDAIAELDEKRTPLI